MRKITKLALILAGSSNLYGSEMKMPYVDNPFWQAKAVESGYIDGDALALKSQINQRLRNEALSMDEYEFMHTPTAKGGIGAQWVKKSIGQGAVIGLYEDSGINHPGVHVSFRSQVLPHTNFTQSQDHGASMASLIHQISPNAHIIARHIDLSDIDTFQEMRVLNFSNDIQSSDFEPHVSHLKNKIVVKSAGNNAQNLSQKGWSPEMSDFMLFAGNLRQDLRSATSSGTPGNDPHIQNNFLWVMADGIMAATGPGGSINQYSPVSGTSSAAAILSGAVAQMMELFPEFSNAQIKECLLESADRDFIQIFEDGHDGIHVSDRHHTTEPGKDKYIQHVWGKGILNLKNAIIYGNLKRAIKPSSKTIKSHRLDASIEVADMHRNLRTQMLGELGKERIKAASLIQKNWKLTKEQVKSLPKRDPLTLDMSKPGFSYERALGDASINTIKQLTPSQEKALRGISTQSFGSARIKKMNIIEARPEIFTRYPFLENIQDSAPYFPTFDEFIANPEKAVHDLNWNFNISLAQEFQGKIFTQKEYGSIMAIKGIVTPLSRFADLLVMGKSQDTDHAELAAAVETFATNLLSQDQVMNKAILQFLTVLKTNGVLYSLSNNFLNELYRHNLLHVPVSKKESRWEEGRSVYYFTSKPFYELDLFSPTQIRETVTPTDFNTFLYNSEFFLRAIQGTVGYSKPSTNRMHDIMEFFSQYGGIFTSEDKNTLFNQTLMRLELFYDQKCSRTQFDTWQASALEMGLTLNETIQGREIIEDER